MHCTSASMPLKAKRCVYASVRRPELDFALMPCHLQHLAGGCLEANKAKLTCSALAPGLALSEGRRQVAGLEKGLQCQQLQRCGQLQAPQAAQHHLTALLSSCLDPPLRRSAHSLRV